MLLAAIAAVFVLVGGLIGGKQGVIIALIFAIAINFGAYWFSADMVLKMYNAQEVGQHNAGDLYSMIMELSNQANIPMPKVYVIDQAQPNAFATGRNPQNAAVVFTVGIMKLLNHDELQGVAAHELSHIKHQDILISTIAAILAGAIAAIANFALLFGTPDEEGKPNLIARILLSILAPIAASIIQMAISRSREYLADEGSAYLTRKPLALANALSKIEQSAQSTPMQIAEEHPATAQMMIINPLSNSHRDNLFSTHPSTHNRIEQLRQIAYKL